MDKKIVLQDGVTFSYDNDGVVRDMSILDGVEEVELYYIWMLQWRIRENVFRT